MFENVDGQTTNAGVIDILIAHLGAFGSGELTRIGRTEQEYAIIGTSYCHRNNSFLTIYLIEMPFNAFANREAQTR